MTRSPSPAVLPPAPRRGRVVGRGCARSRAAALLGMALAVVLAVGLLPAAAGEWHVVGGAPVEDGAWPSTVALVRNADPDPVTGQFCVGTAIAVDLVLTAAHCFHTSGGGLSRQASDVTVVAGRTDLSEDGGVALVGTELYVHPGYEAGRHLQDVAILRVAGDLSVPVQQLAAAGAGVPKPGTVAVTLGWGRTGAGPDNASSRTSVLHEAHVDITSPGQCATALDGTPDPEVHMCAGGDGTEESPEPDACRGDSGGPLLLPVADGDPVQIGITAFGPATCGVADPGVYARVDAAREFIDAVLGGTVSPVLPSGSVAAGEAPVRIAPAELPTTPVAQAIATSRSVFEDGGAAIAVIARDDAFPDALAGSGLVFGRGPLLFTDATGPLDPATRAELRRAVQPGGVVYLLGGPAAVPATVEQELVEDGFTPQRLSGDARESTAVAIAEEVVAVHGEGARPRFGTVVLATSRSWPDAVVAGQLSAWWGFPILLTAPDALSPAVEEVLGRFEVERLITVGGPAAIAPEVVAAAAAVAGDPELVHVAGASRVETAMQMAAFHRAELGRRGQRPPDAVLAVNIRREEGYTHILSAAPLLAATGGVLVPVEGEAGDQLLRAVEREICGWGGLPVGIGGADVLTDEVLDRVARAIAQSAC